MCSPFEIARRPRERHVHAPDQAGTSAYAATGACARRRGWRRDARCGVPGRARHRRVPQPRRWDLRGAVAGRDGQHGQILLCGLRSRDRPRRHRHVGGRALDPSSGVLALGPFPPPVWSCSTSAASRTSTATATPIWRCVDRTSADSDRRSCSATAMALFRAGWPVLEADPASWRGVARDLATSPAMAAWISPSAPGLAEDRHHDLPGQWRRDLRDNERVLHHGRAVALRHSLRATSIAMGSPTSSSAIRNGTSALVARPAGAFYADIHAIDGACSSARRGPRRRWELDVAG